MPRVPAWSLTIVLAAVLRGQEAPPPPPSLPAAGAIVAAGGGSVPPEIHAAALALARGKETRLAILPQASAREDAGAGSREAWLEAGALEAVVVDLAAEEAAVAAVRSADLIWMPGGDQSRLMASLSPAMLALIRERHRAGTVVGGTSAGAAVLSEVMITGEGEGFSLAPGSTPTGAGLGLLRGAIMDQHFLKRKRFQRLLGAVLERPGFVGIGVDESTAAILRGWEIRVVGSSRVVVIDSRKAASAAAGESSPSRAAALRVRVLEPGAVLDLAHPLE